MLQASCDHVHLVTKSGTVAGNVLSRSEMTRVCKASSPVTVKIFAGVPSTVNRAPSSSGSMTCAGG